MNSRKLEIIKQLMDELQEEMQYSEEDFGSRLGREKPTVEMMSLESEEPMDGDELAMEGEVSSPDDELKDRLMKLRG